MRVLVLFQRILSLTSVTRCAILLRETLVPQRRRFCFILDASCIVKGARIQLVLHRFRNLGNADGRCRRKRVKLCCHALPGASLPSEPASSPRDLLDHFPVGVSKRAKEKPEVHFTIGQTPKCK